MSESFSIIFVFFFAFFFKQILQNLYYNFGLFLRFRFLLFFGLLSIVVSGLGRLEIGCVRVVTATELLCTFQLRFEKTHE